MYNILLSTFQFAELVLYIVDWVDPCSAGSDFRRQNLTSKVDPHNTGISNEAEKAN